MEMYSVGSMAAGRMLAGKNISFHIMLAGTCLMVIGTALLSTLSDSESTEKKVYGFQVFIGLGFGLLISTSTFVSDLPWES